MASFLYSTGDHHAAEAIFVFGSLMDRDLLALVVGRDAADIAMTPASVRGFQRRRVAGEHYPVLVHKPDGYVDGCLVEGLTAQDIDRMHFYEGDVYELVPVTATTEDGRRVTALVFLDAGTIAVSRDGWDFQAWLRHEKPMALALAGRLMGHYGHISLRDVEGVWNDIKDQVESLYGYDEEAMAAEAKAYP